MLPFKHPLVAIPLIASFGGGFCNAGRDIAHQNSNPMDYFKNGKRSGLIRFN
jgi:hypothetical protein